MARKSKHGAADRGAARKAAARRPAAAKKRPPGGREKFTPAQIVAALEATGGIVAAAARVLRCSHPTVRNYIQRYPKIAAELEEIEERTLDVAEAALLKLISDGSNPSTQLSAAIFYLRTKGKKRGYSTSTEVFGKAGGPIETKRTPLPLDLQSLNPEELEVLDAILIKATRP